MRGVLVRNGREGELGGTQSNGLARLVLLGELGVRAGWSD